MLDRASSAARGSLQRALFGKESSCRCQCAGRRDQLSPVKKSTLCESAMCSCALTNRHSSLKRFCITASSPENRFIATYWFPFQDQMYKLFAMKSIERNNNNCWCTTHHIIASLEVLSKTVVLFIIGIVHVDISINCIDTDRQTHRQQLDKKANGYDVNDASAIQR